MKNLYFLFAGIILLGASADLKGQFREGEILVNGSLGLRPNISGDIDLPLISLSGEYAATENISAGPYIGYTQSTEDFRPTFDIVARNRLIIVGLRGSFSLELTRNFDLYAGGYIGYTAATTEVIEGDTFFNTNLLGLNVGGERLAAFIGARYLIDNRFGFYGELGYGLSLVNVGLSVNLGRKRLSFL